MRFPASGQFLQQLLPVANATVIHQQLLLPTVLVTEVWPSSLGVVKQGLDLPVGLHSNYLWE